MSTEITEFINSSEYSIFPSSNATGVGKITSEGNLQNIIGRLKIKSFKSDLLDFAPSYNDSTHKLTISAGKGNINGYWLETTASSTVDLTLTDGTYTVMFALVFDNNDLLAPDENSKSECIKLIVETGDDEPDPEYLWLGTITKTGMNISTYLPDNVYPFTLDVIKGPDDSGTLEDFIDDLPNTYVSKIANDTKAGNLVFSNTGSNTSVTIDDSGTVYSYGISPNPTMTMNYSTTTNDFGITVENATNGLDINSTTDLSITGRDNGTTYASMIITTDSASRPIIEYTVLPTATPVMTMTKDGVIFGEVGSTAINIKGTTITAGGTITIGNNVTMSNNLTVTGDITASRVYNAVFNGFGEIFRKDKDEDIEYGDIVCVGSDGLVHKFDSLMYDLNSVIGVCSDTIGFMLGGENIPEDEQVEVELVGQIWVKTNMTYIEPGSMLAIASDGTVRTTTYRSDKFGIALTNVIDGKVRVLYNGHL